MALSLNRVTLIGNLGKDPETRFTTNNVAVTTFSVATSYSYKGKDGNWVNETTWHNVVAFSLSDYIKDNLKKGKKVYVEGRLNTRSYDDNQGVKKYITEIVSDTTKIIPLDAKEYGGGGGNSFSDGDSQASAGTEIYNQSADDNDDLPF